MKELPAGGEPAENGETGSLVEMRDQRPKAVLPPIVGGEIREPGRGGGHLEQCIRVQGDEVAGIPNGVAKEIQPGAHAG